MNEPINQYSVELDRKPYERLSGVALTTLLGEALDGDQRAWHRLWEHGLRMVLKIVNKLEEKELLNIPREEAIAVGNLAIGEALTTWIPKKGSYATWVWVNIRQEILKHNQEFFPDSLTGEEGEDLLEQMDIEEVFENPEEYTQENMLLEDVLDLPREIREVIYLHVWTGLSQSDIAELKGVSRQRINSLYKQGVSLLSNSLNRV